MKKLEFKSYPELKAQWAELNDDQKQYVAGLVGDWLYEKELKKVKETREQAAKYSLTAEEEATYRSKGKIAAIKMVRDRIGLRLAICKLVVENFFGQKGSAA
jgi:ribosomal protein L7/L12